MKTFETKDEAYLALGIQLAKITDFIEDWCENIDELPENKEKFKLLSRAVEQKQDISEDAILMKLFCDYYDDLERYGPSDETYIFFGVRET